jgi:hydroxymethylpyrimidine/phosphomethylpyrimidine kinase
VLADLGAKAILLKGGHGRGAVVRDLLFDGRFFTEFVAPRIRTRATHGTGCTLSSAIAANLALGRDLGDAVLRSIAYLRETLEHGLFPGRGWGVPDHFAGRIRPARRRAT